MVAPPPPEAGLGHTNYLLEKYCTLHQEKENACKYFVTFCCPTLAFLTKLGQNVAGPGPPNSPVPIHVSERKSISYNLHWHTSIHRFIECSLNNSHISPTLSRTITLLERPELTTSDFFWIYLLWLHLCLPYHVPPEYITNLKESCRSKCSKAVNLKKGLASICFWG